MENNQRCRSIVAWRSSLPAVKALRGSQDPSHYKRFSFS
jgi:hypothetical protein